MSKEPTKIFSYGTLQDLAVQKAVFQRELTGHPDVLADHELLLDKVYGRYPVVVPKKDEATKGYCYELREGELNLADAYEGPGYKRRLVTLQSGKRAWVYLENTDHL